MGLLEAIITYLATKGVCDGDGVDCFRDFMPESPDMVITLHEYSGDPLSPYTTSVHRSIQFKIRSLTAEEARSKAIEICSVLWPVNDDRRINLTDTIWGQFYLRQSPFKLMQDESNRVVYCFNLGITTNILD